VFLGRHVFGHSQMALLTEHIQQILDQDLSFAPFRSKILEEEVYETKFYEKTRAKLLEKQSGKLLYQTYGDRRYTYMRCREMLLSQKFPERNKTIFNPSTPKGPRSSISKKLLLARSISGTSTKFPPNKLPHRPRTPSLPTIQDSKENMEPTTSTPISNSTSKILPKPKKTVEIVISLPKPPGHGSAVEYYEFAGMHHVFTHNKRAVTRVKFGRQSRGLLAFSSVDKTKTISNILGLPPSLSLLKGSHKRYIGF